MKIILFGLLIWFLYNIIFRFIIPVYRTTQEVRGKFRQMHRQREEQARQQTQADPSATSSRGPQKTAGDYIDFEEIK